jgi:hypothetical protein
MSRSVAPTPNNWLASTADQEADHRSDRQPGRCSPQTLIGNQPYDLQRRSTDGNANPDLLRALLGQV